MPHPPTWPPSAGGGAFESGSVHSLSGSLVFNFAQLHISPAALQTHIVSAKDPPMWLAP